MELPINSTVPKIMHIDLNSCFATAEQQANPLLRGKPLVVAAYDSPGGCVIAPSIEAKKIGIKVGMRVKDARLIYPKIIVKLPDPPKYRDIHLRFMKIFRQYSPTVTPKSIDEAIIDFETAPVSKVSLLDIGREIKQRICSQIGEWISCNIGIGSNRFLAKLAASLHKPDGLDLIDKHNLLAIYKQVSLLDLNGINLRFQARLNAFGIFTPLEFFKASINLLQKQVFKSICGFHWYLRLRGWEIDDLDFSRKSFGQSYALPVAIDNPKQLAALLTKLCEKMGRRLRQAGFMAQGVHIACLYQDRSFWHLSKKFQTSLFTTQELFLKALLLLSRQPGKKKVSNLAVSCFALIPARPQQLDLFDSCFTKRRKMSQAMDKINDRFGEFTIVPALMMGLNNKIIDRIAFGGVRELLN